MVLPKVKRGQIWEVDFDPQTHKEEPGKRNRPALIIQTDNLNNVGHSTTIIIPGTTDIEDEDCFPVRVALGQLPGLSKPTDLLIDQVRSISNKRFMGAKHIATLSTNHMRRIEEALRILMSL
ncbi:MULTISPECIES: type II toxin-antitoxin system PemK/MazF family toxin [unclassified Undibacterium]|uniref:type II toxin-antitoxin system PemK/MazF family toxin n=1 Tax=unclassified Undibacterium TaxID=2630295 RepID=UPI0033913BCF